MTNHRSPIASGLTRAALVCLCAGLLLGSGCRSITARIQDKVHNIEEGITRKSGEIQDDFEVTITTMAVEHQQFLKCEAIMRAWRQAQNAYQKDFGAYAPGLSTMQGGNKSGTKYVDQAVTASMNGVCYVVEMSATDTDYRMLFEVDKQALVREYRSRLQDKNLPRDQRRHMALRVEQLRSATPCRITATELGATASGQCGFVGDTRQSKDLQ